MRRTNRSLIVVGFLAVAFTQIAQGADHREAILVIDAGARALIRIAPGVSEQEILWSGLPLVRPTDAILEPDGSLLIIDPGAGRIFQFDPRTGGQPTAIDTGGAVFNCWLARISPTELLVSGQDGLIHIGPDPLSPRQLQTLLPTQLVDPFDLVRTQDGSILVADPGLGGLVSVEPASWKATGFSQVDSCWNAINPIDQQIATAGPRGVFLVDAGGGDAVPIASSGFLNDPTAVAFDSHGELFVADRGALGFARGLGGSGPSVIRIDPITGEQTLMSSGGSLVEPVGLVIVPEPRTSLMRLLGSALLVAVGRVRAPKHGARSE